MKKILISIVVVIMIIGLAYALKDIIVINANASASEYRFIQLGTSQRSPDGYIITIFYDKETKIQYGYTGRGGLTLLVDKEGKPLLYEE